ncbi:APC family permease [Streptomyces sp. NPDC002018]|uniref:APC family permease n=1 Tax=Streptomyces sp. NPDC002018 TaxID=3364629 RepID=UPI00368C5EA9
MRSRHDGDPLKALSCEPELKRISGNFHTTAAGISYISILTGTFLLFYFGVEFAGSGHWWSWPLVFLGQLMVALCFCELAARHPVAGPVHGWSATLGGPHLGWLGGWMMLTATTVSLSAVALAYQMTLPQISPFFQFVGTGTGRTDAAANAVLLGSGLIVFTTLVNAFGVTLMARINSAGTLVELIAAVTLIALLAALLTRGPGVSTGTAGYGVGESLGYAGACLTALLASAYVMYGSGSDTTSSPGGESGDPSRGAPRAILRALIASFLIGGLILLFALLAVPDLSSRRLSVDGLQFVMVSALDPAIGEIVLWCVVIAITVCALAVHAAGIRLAFKMARDNCLPASSWLARVSPRFGTPVIPTIVIGLVAVGVLVININQPRIFSVITSIAITMISMAYLMVTLPMLVQRLRGTWRPEEGRFSLGRFGLPVNLLAVLWGIGMSVDLVRPRPAVSNAESPFPWYARWSVLLFVGIVAVGGFTYYWLVQRTRTRTSTPAPAPAPAPAHMNPQQPDCNVVLPTVDVRRPTAGGAETGRPPK